MQFNSVCAWGTESEQYNPFNFFELTSKPVALPNFDKSFSALVTE